MAKIKIKTKFLITFIVLILALISLYFLVSIEFSEISTTTLPKTTTLSTTTTTIPNYLNQTLLELANANIKNKCNVTYTYFERKHFPSSKWFFDVCPNFLGYNETEMWRTNAYLNGECDLERKQMYRGINIHQPR